MELSGSDSPLPSLSAGDGRRNEQRSPSSLQTPDYSNPLVQDALRHLATIDLIELCNEAKVEHCRATRDLSSCRRQVQHVLTSCGHASLCAECSQRFDNCPICRKSIPTSNSRLRLRLYYKCIEAGLISKRHVMEKEVNGELTMTDIQRLYSLFDVALENNLVSLICHYVTDVCMDESAISSDPVFAFLLDEVAVKEWCKQTLKNIIQDLSDIYRLDAEGIASRLSLLQKLVSHLAGISNVLETVASSFKDAYAAQLNDLNFLLEKVLKTKQHLEVIIWCSRHHFLQNVPSRFFTLKMWRKIVIERKKAALTRSWPDFLVNLSDPVRVQDSTLFIEEALLNLGLEENNEKNDEEVDILSLQDGSSPLMFFSMIDEASNNLCYPFQTLRNAADVLFLHGTSDMVVAKQAIFLYYLFDRHWTRSDSEWRRVVDDFASCFGFTKHSFMECFVFFLLDDHNDEALQEASPFLLEISGPDAHPKIARVLLERQVPEVALTFLQCSGRDGINPHVNSGAISSRNVSLGEVVTAIRIRIECGLLTEAFMSLRMFSSAAKEGRLIQGESLDVGDNPKRHSWVSIVEALVTEMCYLCIRRNLVDRMIELPWNSDEEKYLHKCLFDHACQDPSTIYGCLLVVFYLQRFRYTEAYRVNRALLNLEETALESMNDDAALKMRSRSQWRIELVDKGINLLPEVERQKVKNENSSENDMMYSEDVQMTSLPVISDVMSSPAVSNSTLVNSPITSQKDGTFPLKRIGSNASSPMFHLQKENVNKIPSVVQHNLLSSASRPMSRMNTTDTKGASLSPSIVPNYSFSNGTNTGGREWKPEFKEAFRSYDGSTPAKFQLGTGNKDLNELYTSAPSNQFQGIKTSFTVARSGFVSQSDDFHPFLSRDVNSDHNGMVLDSPKAGAHEESRTKSELWRLPDGRSRTTLPGETNLDLWNNQKHDHSSEQILTSGSRWRSDDSSEDEKDHGANRHISIGSSRSTKRRSRTLRR